MEKATAIICVYNEQDTVKDVIIAASLEEHIDEIIVVNDGSSDDSKMIIDSLKTQYDLTVIHFDKNMGKGHAMAVGVENASHEIVVFVDADQTRIAQNYTSELIMMLVNKEADMAVGYTTVDVFKMEINIMKILAGERALFKSDIMPILGKLKESRFGVETLLYFYYISLDKSVKFTKLSGLSHRNKYKKASFKDATSNYIGEGWEIMSVALKHYDLLMAAAQQKIKARKDAGS